MKIEEDFLLPFQRAWVRDRSRLRIMEKSRQVGGSWVDALDSVMKVGKSDARLDVWVSSRDERQARLYLEDCGWWAKVLRRRARMSADALEFRNGRRIYSVSSNPDALAGKRGHVKLDEFALHQNARMLYQVAKPVTTWGGELSIISTHRGAQTVFNELIREVRENGNPMGWSLHSVPIQRAVEEGLVEKIRRKREKDQTERTNRTDQTNGKDRTNGTTAPEKEITERRMEWVGKIRSECIDEEQWLQEYCCVPADESTAFITFEMITGCEDGELKLVGIEEFAEGGGERGEERAFYVGVDVGRKHDLCVIDVGERIGDVVWDRARLEFQGRSFSEIEAELFRLLKLPQVKRACIDATGMGMQLAERAEDRFAWKVEPITFTVAVKEELAFGLRSDFQDRKLRIVSDDKLRSDLRGIKKEVSLSGNIRFLGESKDGHCDRFWAKALRQHAARYRSEVGAAVG